MVPGGPQAGLGETRLVRLVRQRRKLRGRSRHLRRYRDGRTGPGTRRPGAYYWHRFFSHQPDLNFDNPEVQEQMLAVLKFWLDLGLDGFRLDAVPYLFEREGTNCENLPETHEFLKRIRQEVDETYENIVLLAEANQWPSDVVEYFGDGRRVPDVLSTSRFMPRMFMAARRQVRYPIVEILEQTPAIPENCQWGIFLRNHDELTLEMVTDEERDYMYNEYAKDPRMKLTSGSVGASLPCSRTRTTRSELFHAMLLSLPGHSRSSITATRSAWATTSTWVTGTASAPRCNGASTGTPASPARTSPSCTCPCSWIPSTDIRRATSKPRYATSTRSCIGSGGCWRFVSNTPSSGSAPSRSCTPDNPAILAYIRQCNDDIVLCVNNLSGRAQAAELDLSRYEGMYPVELMGRERFPRIGELPYLLTFGPRGFYWFQLIDEES